MKWIRLCLRPGPHYSWNKVGVYLLISIFLTLGGMYVGQWLYYKIVTHSGPTGEIHKVIQQRFGPGFLPNVCLAECLNLSTDTSQSLRQFDCVKGELRLLKTHVIQEAVIKKRKPDTLWITYRLRTPLAFLGDRENTLIDTEGLCMPYLPYYSPQMLPQVWIGKEVSEGVLSEPWGFSISQQKFAVLLEILNRLDPTKIDRIDLSHIFAESAGKRELILLWKGGDLLRLPPKKYLQALDRYFLLQPLLSAQAEDKRACLIDLRLPEVAYVSRFLP